MATAFAQYAMNHTYAEVERLVHGLAWPLARKFREQKEEIFAEAYLAFVEAATDYDPTVARFTTWVGNKVSKKLLRWLKKEAKWTARNLPTEELDYVPQHEYEEEQKFNLKQWVAGLSEDAQLVTSLVFQPPMDIIMMVINIGYETPESFRSAARTFLREKGWSDRRIRRTFMEVRAAL